MSAFHYVALNGQGQEQKGVIEAENDRLARQLLRERNLFPIKIKLAHGKKNSTQLHTLFSAWRGRGISSRELALMTRQFAVLLKAGLPLEEALAAVAEQTEKQSTKGLILSVRSKVLEGHSLATALRESSRAFSDWYTSTVAAGEKSGHLDDVLQRLADYTEQQWRTKQKIQMALIYPTMIVLVATGIVGFLLEYVVPKMVTIYGHLNQGLPTLTAILIATSDAIKNFGLYALLLCVLAGFVFRYFYRKDPVLRERTHAFLLRIPLIGYAARTTNTARFARTLAMLSSSGAPVLEAMAISAQLVTSIPIRKSLETATHHVREGAAMHLSLKQTTYFPPMTVHLIASGEASGQLENMLERVAIQQEEEMVRLIEVGLALFEPAMILIMGAIVLFIVLAVLLPIFQLNQLNF